MRGKYTLTGIVLLLFVLNACQAAATPTPTTPPATPTKAAAPATSTAAAAPAAATATRAPAAASPIAIPATPTTAAKGPTPTGKIVVVIGAEPDNLESENANSKQVFMIGFNVWERMVERDPKTSELKGLLAESWEQVNPTTWRFKLRKGVKFHNGETFKADDVAATIGRLVDPNKPEVRVRRYFPDITSTKIVDENTIEITSKSADPIMPLRMFFMPVDSMKFAKESPEERPTKIIGTGPYKFVEWVKGQFVRLTANENYWGTPNPFKDITFVWRAESTVRAAMIKTGEAQVVQEISPSDAKGLQKTVNNATVETVILRPDTDIAPFKDKRVRQAISYAIDRDSLVKTIMEGNATSASHLFADFVIGYDPSLKPYAFDTAKAKQLLKDGGGEGAAFNLVGHKGRFSRDNEVYEAIVNMLSAVGFKAKVEIREQAAWRDATYAVAPGTRSAMVGIEHGNEFGDASGSYDNYIAKDGRQATYANDQITQQIKAAAAATGQDRVKKYQDVSKFVYEEMPIIPVFHRNQIWGLDPKLDWKPRIDGLLLFKEFTVK